MSDKKYTPKEAAMAVLAKATEIAKKHEHIGWDKLHGKLEREGYSDESADKIAGSIKAKIEKSEEQEKINANSVAGAQGESQPPMNPMKMSESNSPQAPEGNTVGDAQPPKTDPQAQQGDKQGGELAKSGTKGHIKLAKFIGRMEHKRGKSMDKGEDPLNPIAGNRAKRAEGYKAQGDTKSLQIAQDGMKDAHKNRLEGIKSAPKPNLPS